MKLTLKEITEITRGAVRIAENDGAFSFYRFTEKQTEICLSYDTRCFRSNHLATAGIRLAMKTDTTAIRFDYKLLTMSTRGFAYFDVYVNGALEKHFGTSGEDLREGSVCISLPAGVKTVEIYLPYLCCAVLSNIEIDDGASLEGLTRKKTMLTFGDSITQGYDAIHPSLTYASQLARLLDAEQINKGIGGEVFFPPLLEDRDAIEPDYITVAYGTNDWSRTPSREAFADNCRAFYTRLSELYPNARIFAVSPTWRLNGYRTTTGFGAPVTEIYPLMCEICEGLPNVTVIDAYNFIPHQKEFFLDRSLHPNDLGFGQYAMGLYREIIKHV
ncbi:MAG: SGNH/GDSL hydrolase family protein [Clostridia bacterium]|nr:SGNH/GDSL hydrolase family protein [Clostridia bacterium]